MVQWPNVTHLDNQWWVRGNLMQCKASKVQMENDPLFHDWVIKDELDDTYCNSGIQSTNGTLALCYISG